MELLKQLIDIFQGNPITAAVFGSALGCFLFFFFYKTLIKIALSDKNIDALSDAADNYIDKLQQKDAESGKLSRAKLKKICLETIAKLDEADGCN